MLPTLPATRRPHVFAPALPWLVLALALGRPVVGYDHGGVSELLRDHFPRGRVPLGDDAAMLSTIQSVLATPSTPARISEPFTVDAMCRGMLDVYSQLLQTKSVESESVHLFGPSTNDISNESHSDRKTLQGVANVISCSQC